MTPFLKELLEKNEIEDILFNGRGIFYYEKNSWQGPYADPICEEKNLFVFSRRIADKANITLGLTQPSADSFIDFQGHQLFRAHVVVAPMSVQGTEITLRRIPAAKKYSLRDFTSDKITEEKLAGFVRDKKSVLIAGATGAGKSSLLSALMSEIPLQDRVIILEDTPELPMPNLLSSKLIARTDRFGFREGAEWNLSDLVFESLRMRPDRIVIGECRGPEALGIYQALMTGHRGVLTSLHAGSCQEAIARFDELVRSATKNSVASSVKLWDAVIFINLAHDGQRVLKEVYERKDS